MRVISGSFKGTKLNMPEEKSTRPLKDMVRESIFNLLIHSKKILLQMEKCRVLDLYAGSGSFGIECISRKVAHVSFVENNKLAFKILDKNIEKLKIKNKTKTFFEDVFQFLNKINDIKLEFDLIFCDPPFKDEALNDLIKLIFNKKLLSKNGILIIHRNKETKDNFPEYLNVIDERIYGVSKIIFGRF